MVKKSLGRINKFKKVFSGKYSSDNFFGEITIEKVREKTWEVCNISVEPQYRKMGYGKKMVKHAFKFMRNNGATGVMLNCPVDEASGFWNKMGFSDVNKRKKL